MNEIRRNVLPPTIGNESSRVQFSNICIHEWLTGLSPGPGDESLLRLLLGVSAILDSLKRVEPVLEFLFRP